MTDRPRCQATRTNGEQCRAFAMPDREVCRYHAASDAERRAWSAKGGRARPRKPVDPDADPSSLSARELLEWARKRLALAWQGVERGETDPRQAHAVSAIANALRGLVSAELDIVVADEIERRIEELERGDGDAGNDAWASPGAATAFR